MNTTPTPQQLVSLEQALLTRIPKKELRRWLEEYSLPYRELMSYYRCAMMEVETKFHVLNEDLSLQYDSNPIESIRTRLKTPESIFNKLMAHDFPMTVESIEKNINDIAGVRVICTFPSDIYMLADALLQQDDVTLVRKKDYIQDPKPNGYRSLHLIISTPIFLHDKKRLMKVEVQLRTLAMDLWASTEHKLRYKKDFPQDSSLDQELRICAQLSADLDQRLEHIRQQVQDSGEKTEPRE